MKKNGKKKKSVWLFILITGAVLLFLLSVPAGCAWITTGDLPSESETAFYQKFPNFRNGRFQNQEEIALNTRKMAKKAGFFRFIFSSPNAPRTPWKKVELVRSSFPARPEEFNVCWLGHSSLIFELGGRRFIVDPVFGNAAPLPGIMRRFTACPLPLEELPDLDFMVISHDHYDHLEYQTIRAVRKKDFPIITSLGVGARLRGWGIKPERIIELNWGQSINVAGVKITAHTARHFSGRTLNDRFKTLWSSFSFERNGKKIFFGADGGYGKHFAEIGKSHGPFDLVCLEIDAWNERWPHNHSFPHEVIKEFKELRGKKLLPIHWGVFDLAMHPYYESINKVLELSKAAGIQIIVPPMGARCRLE